MVNTINKQSINKINTFGEVEFLIVLVRCGFLGLFIFSVIFILLSFLNFFFLFFVIILRPFPDQFSFVEFDAFRFDEFFTRLFVFEYYEARSFEKPFFLNFVKVGTSCARDDISMCFEEFKNRIKLFS